jgi:hypothetical protein
MKDDRLVVEVTIPKQFQPDRPVRFIDHDPARQLQLRAGQEPLAFMVGIAHGHKVV